MNFQKPYTGDSISWMALVFCQLKMFDRFSYVQLIFIRLDKIVKSNMKRKNICSFRSESNTLQWTKKTVQSWIQWLMSDVFKFFILFQIKISLINNANNPFRWLVKSFLLLLFLMSGMAMSWPANKNAEEMHKFSLKKWAYQSVNITWFVITCVYVCLRYTIFTLQTVYFSLMPLDTFIIWRHCCWLSYVHTGTVGTHFTRLLLTIKVRQTMM